MTTKTQLSPGIFSEGARSGLLSRRLHLVTGKGGVGKSTLVAALGLALSRAGRRPLIVELGHRASIEEVLGVSSVGYAPSEVAPGLFASNMDLHASIADYVGDHLRVRALGRLAVRSATLRRFFEAAPGVSEVATLHRLRGILEAGEFDVVIVDLDATGHARMFFELPGVFSEIAEDGPVRKLLDRVSSLLRDESTTALHVVTVPSELPVQEAIELYRDLAKDGTVVLGSIIANMVPEAPFEGEVASAILRDESQSSDVELARRAIEERSRAESLVVRLRREVPIPVIELPRLLGAGVSADGLSVLGEALTIALAGEASR